MGPETDPKGAGEAPIASRRAEQADDSRLSTETVAFLSSLNQSVRPYQLAVRFPASSTTWPGSGSSPDSWIGTSMSCPSTPAAIDRASR
jgi:hypothetical protein